jgi:pyruvate,water dikinase
MADPVFVRRFPDMTIADRELAGGKGASLAELTRAGFPVPDGYVVTTLAFTQALAPLGLHASLREIERLPLGDHAGIERAAASIRSSIVKAPLPAGLRGAIAEHYLSLLPQSHSLERNAAATPGHQAGGEDGPPVAIRSSATAEDSANASFAGLQDTYLWVRGPDAVAEHVRRCWASLYSTESVSYRRRLGLPEAGLAMAVVVQRMVDARCSGVMFTASPATGDRSVIAVEASWGLGSAIVGGAVTPDTYLVSKVTDEIVRRRVAIKARQHLMAPGGTGVVERDVPADLQGRACLSDAQIRALARLGRHIEDLYGSPQDIEWAITRDITAGDGVFLLQSRPETAWANRESTPVATPKPTPFGHVIELLSKNRPS